MFQSRPKDIAHTRVYTVCLTELSLNFSLQNNFLCLHNIDMEEDNFVIPACILVIAAFCLMNMNLLVSDGVKLNSYFLFLCRILNQVVKFFIETEPINDMLFPLSVLFMFKRLQKSRENRTCTDVLFIEYPHDLISDWLNSSTTYMSDRPNRNKFYSVCQHICRMFSQFTRYVLSSALKHICQNISCK